MNEELDKDLRYMLEDSEDILFEAESQLKNHVKKGEPLYAKRLNALRKIEALKELLDIIPR